MLPTKVEGLTAKIDSRVSVIAADRSKKAGHKRPTKEIESDGTSAVLERWFSFPSGIDRVVRYC